MPPESWTLRWCCDVQFENRDGSMVQFDTFYILDFKGCPYRGLIRREACLDEEWVDRDHPVAGRVGGAVNSSRLTTSSGFGLHTLFQNHLGSTRCTQMSDAMVWPVLMLQHAPLSQRS